MQGDGWAGTGQGVHLARVAELVFERDSGGELDEFAEARSGIGKSPRGQFDIEIVQCPMNECVRLFRHASASPVQPLNSFNFLSANVISQADPAGCARMFAHLATAPRILRVRIV